VAVTRRVLIEQAAEVTLLGADRRTVHDDLEVVIGCDYREPPSEAAAELRDGDAARAVFLDPAEDDARALLDLPRGRQRIELDLPLRRCSLQALVVHDEPGG